MPTIVIVIDVIRAFTAAAVAFEGGATDILCAGSLASARELRRRHPERLLFGERAGRRPADFDFGNSPAELAAADLTGRGLIQATTNGTRGLLHPPAPAALLAASAVNAAATARWVRHHHPATPWTLLCTGETSEDHACAAYLRSLLEGGTPDRAALAAGIARGAQEHGMPPYLRADLPYCQAVDRCDFAMVGTRHEDHVRLTTAPA